MGWLPVSPWRLGASQNVTITSTSASSSAVGAHTLAVRLIATAACEVAFGPSPTATTSSTALAANVPEVFTIGSGDKVAVIGTSGTLNITELSH